MKIKYRQKKLSFNYKRWRKGTKVIVTNFYDKVDEDNLKEVGYNIGSIFKINEIIGDDEIEDNNGDTSIQFLIRPSLKDEKGTAFAICVNCLMKYEE